MYSSSNVRHPTCERPIDSPLYDTEPAAPARDILASLIGGKNAYDTAAAILYNHSLIELTKMSVDELCCVPKVNRQVAERIRAAVALARRLSMPVDDRPQVRSPNDAAQLLLHDMSQLEREEMRVIVLDTKNRVLRVVTVYRGSLNTSMLRIGELFNAAVRLNAASIIVAHNHPSGDTTPSAEDVLVTSQLVEAGKLLDIDVLDHVIIAAGRYISLRERGLGFTKS